MLDHMILFLFQIPDNDLEARRIGQRVDSLTGDIYTREVYAPDRSSVVNVPTRIVPEKIELFVKGERACVYYFSIFFIMCKCVCSGFQS